MRPACHGFRDSRRGESPNSRPGDSRGWPVSRILSRLTPPTAIPLGPSSPTGSSSQPGSLGRENPGAPLGVPRDPYLALLLAGLAVPPTLPPARWALTPPFHPCPPAEAFGRSDLCGAFPRVTPGGRYPPPFLPGVRTFLDLAAAAVQPSAPALSRRRAAWRQHAGRRGRGARRYPPPRAPPTAPTVAGAAAPR